MKVLADFSFSMRVNGDTGHSNKSILSFDLPSIGRLTVDYKAWNLEFIQEGTQFKNFSLNIPSGNLEIFDGTIKITPDKYCPEINSILFQGEGEWDGMINGLLGGMSGYGNFRMTSEDGTVREGTLLVPFDRWNWGGRNLPYWVDTSEGIWQCKFSVYMKRLNEYRKIHGYDESCIVFKNMNRLRQILFEELDEGQREYLQSIWKELEEISIIKE